MNRPSLDASLRPLKSFQRCTVDHAFHRLFTAEDSTGRFLVADEVGLGKTLVARGIIARAIDHLWNDVERIDIVYICSNAGIARANLPKLKIGGAEERSFALATRLTMLATELARKEGEPGLVDSKLNFVSFTPGTSFNMGHSAGQRPEREVLFHLLNPIIGRPTALMNLLQGWITDKDDWRRHLKNRPRPIEATIRQRFATAFCQKPDLQKRLSELLDRWFRRYRKSWPADARYLRDRVISDLRRVLAGACVEALEPDLVILDEFQRFKSLLETHDDERDVAADLAQELFQATAHDGKRVRTLLLSATPYKLYTADAEIEREDHYEDFLATTRFLLGDDDGRVEEVKHRLSRFGSALKRGAAGELNQTEQIGVAKRAVEDALRDVMARTERVSASDDRDAMVDEDPRTIAVNSSDVRQYLAADALFRAVGDRDPMSFWKSAPYLAHFMHGYRFNERFEEAYRAPEKIVSALQRHDSAFLKAAELRSWSKIDPANPKLRELVDELIDDGLWKLLWMPPTLPYWPLEGPFKGKEQATKRLLFSAWNVVPDVVSAILSYEAERLMTGTGSRIGSYESPSEQQRQLLRLTQSKDGGRSRHRLLLLLLPCIPLADLAHPLHAPPGQDRRAWVRERVEDLLAAPELPNPQDGKIDERWVWVAPLLLDSGLRSFLRAWARGELPGLSDGELLPQPNPDVFGAYVEDLLEIEPGNLGRRPPSLADLLTEISLGSPAILAARSLKGGAQIGDGARRRLAAVISHAFWRLFNQPAVISLMRQLAVDSADSRDESAYWRLVLRYCQQGNLQAVLDEQWHLLWDQESWSNDASDEKTAGRCAAKLVQVVRPMRARVHARFFLARGGGTGAALESDEIRIRTVFALRFGHIRKEEGDPISQDAVRAAFNSPFRPFVLTSTSIGQEGLDFHPWCHCLVHWNLPGNPVDLEQREGRIHRYKGHAIRRNVAASHDDDALASWQLGDDIWTLVFELAERAARATGASDLVPHWIAPGGHRVRRYVPQLPYTTEVEAFERLKRQLAAYRVVFGQPRQEELLTLLGRSEVATERLNDWSVDLSPPALRIDRE